MRRRNLLKSELPKRAINKLIFNSQCVRAGGQSPGADCVSKLGYATDQWWLTRCSHTIYCVTATGHQWDEGLAVQIQDLCQWPWFASVVRWKVNFETIFSTLSPIDQELYGPVIFPLTNYMDLVGPTRSKEIVVDMAGAWLIPQLNCHL